MILAWKNSEFQIVSIKARTLKQRSLQFYIIFQSIRVIELAVLHSHNRCDTLLLAYLQQIEYGQSWKRLQKFEVLFHHLVFEVRCDYYQREHSVLLERVHEECRCGYLEDKLIESCMDGEQADDEPDFEAYEHSCACKVKYPDTDKPSF